MPKSNSTHQTVRVRFAPSPTGTLHVGGARTALFNWLFARHNQGTFILRIEDTDRERSREEYVREIISSLEWLGLCQDEAPCFQSRRMDLYRAAADTLLDSGRAYRCFCTPEELATRRREAADRGGVFKYDGRCFGLSPQEVEKRMSRGEKPVLRIRIPEGVSSWEDIVRGTINFDNSQLDDFIIYKSSEVPTYHFAVVVDDIDMSITHVIRGDDHISNTPKQLILYDALESPPPRMAHIPLIHGSDGGRLSKRHGATAVLDYRKMGYLPEAMVNYLALLGWSPGDDREIMSLKEIASLFDLEKVVKTPAIFDLEKLTWMNGNYLSDMSPACKVDLIFPFLVEASLITPGQFEERKEWLEKLIEVVGDRIKLLSEIVPHSRFFFADRITPDGKAAKVIEKSRSNAAVFKDIADELELLDEYDRSTIEGTIRAIMDSVSLSPRKVLQPIRAAVSGSIASPGLFESMELLGKEKTIQRIREHLVQADDTEF